MSGKTTAGPALRWFRALVLAVAGVATGAAFHAGADGLLPGPTSMAALVLVSTVAAAPLLGAPASTRRVVALLVTWQTLVHGALTVLSGHRDLTSVPAPPAHAARSDHAAVLPTPDEGFAEIVVRDVAHLVEDVTGAHPGMVLGHLAAAALVGLWLAAGERALWAVLALVAAPVVAVASALWTAALGGPWFGPRAGNGVETAVPADGADGLVLWFLVRAVPRRGPPVTA